MTDFPPHNDRGRGGLWPTAAAVACGALFTALPPESDAAFRSGLTRFAGPVLALLPAPPVADEADRGAAAPVAELAGEIARLRAALARAERDAAFGGAGDPLVGPAWLTAEALGGAAGRGRVRSLLIAAVGREGAATDAAGLNGDLPAVDAGADRQVRAGDLVVRGGAVVGRVDAAGRWTATVRPLTDPDFRLVVTVPDAAGGESQAVLAGAGGGRCVLRHLPTRAAVRAGAVVTCGAAETGGAALPVGVVESAEPGGGAVVRPLAELAADATGAVSVVRAGLNRRRVPTDGGDDSFGEAP